MRRRRVGCRRVVWASSETTLGLPFDVPPRYAPVDEAHYPHPTSTYALSKVASETIAEQIACVGRDSLRGVALLERVPARRLCAGAGVLGGRPTCANGTCWGYVDVRDAAQACRRALEIDITGTERFIIAAADTVMRTPSRALLDGGLPRCRADTRDRRARDAAVDRSRTRAPRLRAAALLAHRARGIAAANAAAGAAAGRAVLGPHFAPGGVGAPSLGAAGSDDDALVHELGGAVTTNEVERQRWNDERWAALWPKRERLTDAVSAFVLDAAAPAPGERVLDVGCGGGRTALAAGLAVGAAGRGRRRRHLDAADRACEAAGSAGRRCERHVPGARHADRHRRGRGLRRGAEPVRSDVLRRADHRVRQHPRASAARWPPCLRVLAGRREEPVVLRPGDRRVSPTPARPARRGRPRPGRSRSRTSSGPPPSWARRASSTFAAPLTSSRSRRRRTLSWTRPSSS